MSQKILDELAKTSIQLMLKEAFYGHFFSSLLRDVSQETESMALRLGGSQMLKLLVNPSYWEEKLKGATPKQTAALRYGAIKHQILHIVFKHILRARDFGNKQLYGIAADLAVNQYIDSDQLEEEAIRLEDFPDFSLERGQSLDYYYKRLSDELEEMMNGGGGSEENDEFNSAQQKLQALLEEEHPHLEQHAFWDDIQQQSPSEQKIIEAFVNDAIQNSLERLKTRNYTNLPAQLQEYLDQLMKSLQPSINWRRTLRLFAASSSRTRIRNTIKKPSKRYGTSPGIKIQRKQKIGVALDSSGSVNQEELQLFFSELYHIWKQGAEIMVVECDVDIQRIYPYRGKTPELVQGRGGTRFDAPIKWANEDYRPDALIYFTDGFAAKPEVRCRVPLLWMISPNGLGAENWESLPGRKVKMQSKGGF